MNRTARFKRSECFGVPLVVVFQGFDMITLTHLDAHVHTGAATWGYGDKETDWCVCVCVW